MNPILFRYGGFALHYSHVIFMGSFLFCYQLSFTWAKRLGINKDDWDGNLTYYLFGGIIGSRLGYILSHLSEFQGRWRESLTLWHGAFSVWGAILGFLFTAVILNYLNKKASFKGLDILGFVFPLFLGLNELGLFIEGEGWGKVGEGFWVLDNSGVARYPIWLGYFIWYCITAFRLSYRKSQWDGENFLFMSASLALATLLFSGWSLLARSELAFNYIWSILFLLGSLIILFRKEKIKIKKDVQNSQE